MGWVAAIGTTILMSIASGASVDSGLPRYAIQLPPPEHLRAQGVAVTQNFDGRGNVIQMVANDRAPVAYFLDQLPSDLNLAGLPAEAKDVVVARVRAIMSPSSLSGRDQSGAPAKLPRDRLFIRIKVMEVLRGNAAVGEEYAIYFGEPGREFAYPLSPEQLTRDYVSIIYRDSLDAKRRLLGVSISLAQFMKWQEEISNHRRSLLKK
ncbi:hypothetical protein [Bradyrhizobium sp. AUGA SZCCT0160]|uniref:hypothetical protein n=1 Tax=Bradyrhizobium sp. AUGA SZCCT0160 TaxID=2807662 RepID=UPI001BA54DF4|nr:hypothetical protein [Bradyrhizobium sp. AUGA SZCCT0160]MBR1187436.1 hypothetical protein [Bradyrhizobium sp. AUGA SZCCT0160]